MERYAIQEVVGLGGMGAVYRARDLHFPNVIKLVAVKEMINQAPDPLVRQTIVQNFEREANILVTLSHPSIPKIFDYFTHDERSYLVEEFINGKNLETIINDSSGYIPENQVISWAVEICEVLKYLHTHKPEPIIFRDIKPSNIMVNQHNHIMLVDFGIAKVFKAGQKGTMIGTEGYSPPEQYRGEATPVADIYSLGATLHHVITKRDPRLEPPFTFGDRPIRKINPAVSIDFENIINTALQYNHEERYQTAEAMRDALINMAKKTGIFAGVGLSTIKLADEDAIKPLWMFRTDDEIRGSATCDSSEVFVGSYDGNLYSLKAANGELSWKYQTDGGITTRPAIYNGVVYFGSEDKKLHAISSKTGKLQWSFLTEGPIRCSPLIAGAHIITGSDDGYLYAINIASSKITWRIDSGGAIRSTPISANELIVFGNENGEVHCIDLRGEVIWRFKAKRAITSSPVYYEGVVYFTSHDGTCYALDGNSGWVIWRFRMSKGSISSPCAQDNYLYFGSADGYLYCIDCGSGREEWRFKTEHQVSGSPMVFNQSVYCGSADGYLYCIDHRNGRLRWKFETGGAITATPIVHGDVLFFGSFDNCFYALLP